VTAQADPRESVVVGLVQDLFFAGRIRAAGEACGVPVRLVRGEQALLEAAAGAGLVLVDLEARSVDAAAAIRALKARAPGVVVVGFGAHVNTAALLAGRAAGADRVLARSAFTRELPALLRSAAQGLR
jgi:DNA-binding NarL/FixJ family response regulator